MMPSRQEVIAHLRNQYSLTMGEVLALLNTPQHPRGLRDEFAMAALPKLIRESDTYKDIAIQAYFMSDAMLEVRNANR